MRKLTEKRIELSSPYPVKNDEIIDLINRSNRLICKETDNKTIQLYIYTRKRGKHDAFAEVEITSAGYILHGDEGYDYQGTSIKEFNNDLNEVIVHYDFDVFPKKFGENITNKDQLFDNILNESIDDAGYALTKLKGYLNFNIRWEYDGDGEPYLVDNENEPPLYTVQWTETESGSRQGYYSVEVKQDEEWDSTIYNFYDVRSTYQKIEDIMRQRSALLERKGDFKKYALLGAAALGLGAVKVADINSIKSAANELNIKVPAIEYSSSHKGAKLIKPIYKYKYDGKGPMDIDSLCKWLELNTEFEDIWYEEDGDNYVIKYRNRYYSYADDSSNPKRRTTYGKIDLPKSYFDDWTYSLDENKKIALFDKLLKE